MSDSRPAIDDEALPRLAALQMASGPNVSANLLEARRLIGLAAQQGARVVVLPENFAYMGERESDVVNIAETQGDGPMQGFLAEAAKEHGIWLIGGTIPLKSEATGRVRAASLAFNQDGVQVARYDKIHLFDVELPQTQEKYQESATFEAGDQITVFDTPCGRVGMAVCYDLRFPELFRALSERDVTVLAVPASFTEITGRAHWEVLVRARAIENLSYVVAAAQGGYHISGRETHGHSMIVDPWGSILGTQARGAAVITADYDVERLRQTRNHFPAVSHRRFRCQGPQPVGSDTS